MESSGLIFDYATTYYYSHEKIAEPKLFKLTNDEYQKFVNWMESKSFENLSQVEQSLDLLKEAAAEDNVYANLVSEIEAIHQAVGQIKTNGLESFKEEIIGLLEQAILLRYYYSPGQLEASLDKDPNIKEAIEILSYTERYNAIISG